MNLFSSVGALEIGANSELTGVSGKREGHPMVEAEFERRALALAVESALVEVAPETGDLRVSTPGGRFHVRWDENESASALAPGPSHSANISV